MIIIYFEKYFYKALTIKCPISYVVRYYQIQRHLYSLPSSQVKINPFTYILFGICDLKIIHTVTVATSAEVADAVPVTSFFF